MGTAALCKALSLFMLGLESIGSLILAITYANAGWDFNFGIFLLTLVCGILVGLLSCVPLYALGEILEYLDTFNHYLYNISSAFTAKPSSSSTSSSSAPSAPAPFIRHQSGASWTCSCGQKNDALDQTCKNCGKYK